MKKLTLATLFALASLTASASTSYCLGYEDNHTAVSDHDNNDATACVSGATIHTSGTWTPLTASLALSNSGTPFWNNLSADELHANFGDEVLGIGTYSVPLLLTPEYLSDATGHMVNDVMFSGGAVVINKGGITGDTDKLGVCYLSDCTGTTVWLTGPILSFVATGNWQFVAENGAGQFSYSDPMGSQTSSFAVDRGSAVPEPNAAWMVFIGGAAIMCGSARRWRNKR